MKNQFDQKWLDEVAVVALGCSLPGSYPSREALLDAAIGAIEAGDLKVVGRSSWWASAAWPDPTAPAYRNGVVLVETPLPASEILARLHRIETHFGRVRIDSNAPRTLDLDLIAQGRTVTEVGLVLPHPRAHERLFVMGPLAEISPEWRHPVSGRTAADLAAAATVGSDAAPDIAKT
ncbi:2-amino-4-hydroxy-6-hydroxymethyldihydropteridine diphosphokinase [Caulobacter sp. DWP3-1-3b2]|uniref:2-amino-4-hydroxy-6- hydroxymethyldihydropteridine diphosphokinase n=1 Tax=Caulobacter sp. DWP3-1-3b2 TaxID=2804643 RepID=UPI003CF019F1